MHTANSEPNTPNTHSIENFLFNIDSSITVIYRNPGHIEGKIF